MKMSLRRGCLGKGIPHAKATVLAVGVAFLALPLLARAQDVNEKSDQQASNASVKLETIEVTGSRLKQVDVEGPLPVTVITRQQIDTSGDLTVTDYLRRLDFNSFGSFTASSGFSGGAQGGAQISLRGLGAQRTLILVDGRRLPASPAFSGAAANLNIIPLSLVERIEVLREGASAIYGSDAIGGVINIITKKNYEGLEISGQLDRPQLPGGDAASASFIAGVASAKGNMFFALDHSQKDIIFMRDRDYSKNLNSAIGNPGTVVYAQNPTITDNPATPVDESEVGAVEGAFANCPTQFDTNPNFPDSKRSGFFCRYRFGAHAGQTAALSRDTLTVGGNYLFSDALTGFTRLTSTRAESFGRFAAAPVTDNLIVQPNNPNNPTIGRADCNTDPKQGCRLQLFFRPTDNGTRDNTVVDTVTQFLTGLNGRVNWWTPADWEVGLSHNKYLQREVGTGYGLIRELQAAVDSGAYNPFNTLSPTNSGRTFAYTITSTNAFISKGVDGRLSFDNLLGNSAFRLPLVVGGEYRREDFQTVSDAQSAQSIVFNAAGNISNFTESNVFGSAGGSAIGGRDYYGVYGESAAGLFDNMLNIDLAMRYDKYTLGGGKTSPKLSISVRPIDTLLVRASLSKGFRAPDLSSLFGSPSQSFENAIDRVGCAANPANTEACSVNQRKTAFDSNRTLKPEKSDNYNMGLVLSPTKELSFSVDYYRINLKEAITSLDVQAVLDNELRCQQAGRKCDPFSEGTVVRNPDGSINFVYSPATNAAKVETNGVDFGGQYALSTPIGSFSSNLTLSYVNSYKQQDSALGSLIERKDTRGVPKMRSTLGLGWTMSAYSATVIGRYIDKTKDCTALERDSASKKCNKSVRSFTTWDGQFSWKTPWKGEAAVGMRNMFNRQPSIAANLKGATSSGVDYTLYDIDGRVPYIRLTQSF